MENFYRTRDAMNGGTDNLWTEAAQFEPAGPADDAEDGDQVVNIDYGSYGGTLSQSDLAS